MDKTYYKAFERRVLEELVKIASSQRFLGNDVCEVEELNDAWRAMAPLYMTDAVPLVADYPLVSVAWAGYLGVGAAALWDENWNDHNDYENLYRSMVTPRGFDSMDEYVGEKLLHMNLESAAYLKLEDTMRSLATQALALIRHEQVEPQTPEAFQIYARAVKVMYVVGYSMQLYTLGYRYHKVDAQFEKE